MKMKKVLAMRLAFFMVFALAAYSGGSCARQSLSPSASQPSESTPAGEPVTGVDRRI